MRSEGQVLGDLLDGGADGGGEVNLNALDDLLLQRLIGLGPRKNGGVGAHGGQCRGHDLGAGGTDALTGEIGRAMNRILGEELTLALIVVEGQDLEAGILQLAAQALVGLGLEQLGGFLVILGDVRSKQHAEVIHIVGQTARLGHNADARADDRLLEHVLVAAQLAAGVNLNLHVAVGLLLNLLFKDLGQRDVERIGLGQNGADLEVVRLGAGARRKGDGQNQSQAQGKQLFHCVSSSTDVIGSS